MISNLTKTLTLCCLMVLGYSAQAQFTVVWGGPDDPNSTFDGGLNDWTDSSNDPNGTWTWEDDAAAFGGAYYGTRGPIDSPSAGNGAAVFNSDFYDNAGIPGNFCGASGTPVLSCAPQTGVLTSPNIDLSGVPDGQLLAVQFNQYYRNFQSSTQVTYSNDGGATWIDTITINEDIAVNAGTDPGDVQLLRLPGAGGTDQFQLRFIFNANYYFWIIDDVQIIEAPARDLEVADFFYPVSYAVTPESQIAIDTFGFQTTIVNNGTEDATDVMVTVEVRNTDTDPATVVHTQTVDLGTVESDSTRVADFDMFDTFVPDLVEGTYDVRYSVTSSNGDEQLPADNVDGNSFAVSVGRYAMSFGGASTFTRPGTTQNYFAANFYRTGPFDDNPAGYIATDVLFEATVRTSEIGDIPDTELPVYLFKVLPDWDATLDPLDPAAPDPNLELLSIVTVPFNAAEADTATVFTVELEDLDENMGVVLEPNSEYMVGVQYYGTDNLIFQGFNRARVFPGIPSLLWFDQDGQWGRFGADYGITVELFIEGILSSTEDMLPESAFEVSPNPAVDVVTATVSLENTSRATVRVFDMMGRVIETRNFANLTSEQVQFDVSQYANGTYTLHLTTEEGISTQKFVVNH